MEIFYTVILCVFSIWPALVYFFAYEVSESIKRHEKRRRASKPWAPWQLVLVWFSFLGIYSAIGALVMDVGGVYVVAYAIGGVFFLTMIVAYHEALDARIERKEKEIDDDKKRFGISGE